MKKTTQLKCKEQRAVSPVIGVILMVAITVILAAVIGTFVLGIGGDIENPPQAGFDTSDDGDNVTINLINAKNLDTWNVTGVSTAGEPVLVNGEEANSTGYATYLGAEDILVVERARVGDSVEWNYDNSGSRVNIIGVYETEDSVLQSIDLGN